MYKVAYRKTKTNLNLSTMKFTATPAFNFARRISRIDLGDIVLDDWPDKRLILLIDGDYLHACNPIVGFYGACIRHQRTNRFSNVAEYLYYSLMYKTPISEEIHKYLDDRTGNGYILLRVRHLQLKRKSIAAFIDRLDSIFDRYKFGKTLSLTRISVAMKYVVEPAHAIHLTMRFNYLNRIVTKLYTKPNEAIKILTYLILLR